MKILLAGTPRCGSTWAANVLGRAADTRAVFEPDGPISDILGTVVASRISDYPVMAAGHDSRWYRATWDLAFTGGWPWDRNQAARAAGRRLVRVPRAARDWGVLALAHGVATLRRRPENVVVKSVNSALALEWIANRYQPCMVLLRRNPLNVVSSWLQLEMMPRLPLWDDPRVRQSYMAQLGIAPPRPDASEVAQVAWTVGLLYTALRRSAERHSDWIVVSHDDLCRDPRTQYTALYRRLGLRWTEETDAYLEASDRPGFTVHGGQGNLHPNAVTGTVETESRRTQQATQYRRRLSADQVDEVMSVLAGFSLGEWGVPD